MNAGKLDRRIVIQRRAVGGKAATGEDVFAWINVVSCWAEFQANRGQERLIDQQKHAEADAMFRIRYFPGITPEMRVIYEGVTYDISAVVPMRGRRTGLDLMVVRGLTNG